MKIGKNDIETFKLNKWKVGDILEGKRFLDGDVTQIKITAINESNFCCRWKIENGKEEWGKKNLHPCLDLENGEKLIRACILINLVL